MSGKIVIDYKDYVNCVLTLQCDNKVNETIDRNILYEHFSQFVPSAKFTPKYKLGIWDGYIRFYSENGRFFNNLVEEALGLVDLNNYDSIIVKTPNSDSDVVIPFPTGKIPGDPEFEPIDVNFLSDNKWGKGHKLEGQPVVLYEHQVNIINTCLKNIRSICVAATGAGKTNCAVALAKCVLKYGRFMVIEPSKDLTLQTAQVFRDMGIDVGVVGCGRREVDKPVLVCTWQTLNSVEKRKSNLMLDDDKRELSFEELTKIKDNLVGVLCDEVHCCKSAEIGNLFKKTFKDVPIRWGLTGTIPKAKVDRYSLISAIGKVIDVVDSKELQEKGVLADCEIDCIRMEDNLQFRTFDDEMNYLSTNEDRLKFISNLVGNITKVSGNSLVFVNRIATGEFLEAELKKNGCDCVFLDGSVKSDKRLAEYKSISNTDNKCIIATVQIASTGLDIPRIFNLFLIDIGKSFIRVIQSIGRSLRLGRDKNFARIYDVFSTTKFSRTHFNDRVHFYHEKKFNFKVLDIKNWRQ